MIGSQADRMPFCGAPFDDGPKLCDTCAWRARGAGFRRCARVVAESAAMRQLLELAVPVAMAEAPVVIYGETGVGKEVLARALHANSPRKRKPFLALNMAALPAELLESELFGHAKGAFTGAVAAKPGLFEAADGGTLLLDELAETPLPLQAKLLRVLQDGEVRRVGDIRPFNVDVRIMCATNQDLRTCVAERRFREDLYYRLKVLTLRVPALRERREDILPLALLFLRDEGHGSGHFKRQTLRALERHCWPGNVRELSNAVRHAAAFSRGADVDLIHLPEEIARPGRAGGPKGSTGSGSTLADVERAHVLRVLEECGGRRTEAAQVLGVGRATLWRRLREFQAQR